MARQSPRVVRSRNPLGRILIGAVVILALAGTGGGFFWYTSVQETQRAQATSTAAAAQEQATAETVAQEQLRAAEATTATAAARDAELSRQYDVAVAMENAGDLEQAREAFQQLLAQEPGFRDVAERLRVVSEKLAESLYQQGVAASSEKQWSDAVEVFDKLLTINPGYKDTPVLRAAAARELNATPTASPRPTQVATATPSEATPTGVTAEGATTEATVDNATAQAVVEGATTEATPSVAVGDGAEGQILDATALPKCPPVIPFGQVAICTITAASEIDDYTFEAKADDIFLVRIFRASETINPWVRIYAPDGAEICEAYAERFLEIYPCRIPRTGTYTIKVSDASRNRSETGDYFLFMQRINNPAIFTTVDYGQPVERSVKLPTQIDTYRMTGNVDDIVYIRAIRVSETVQPWIRVFSPDGSEVCEGYDDRLIDQLFCTLPRSGDFTILVGDASRARTEVGDYRMYIQRVNKPGNTKPISVGDTVEGMITHTIGVDSYSFEGKADEIITIRATRTSETVQPWVRIFAPTGQMVCESYHERLVEMPRCVLPRSGTYTILFADASRGRSEVGNYTLYLGNP